MSPASGAVPGADGVYLSISADAVTLRCDTHADLAVSYPYGDDRKVPTSWVVSVLANHMKNHPAAPADGPSDDETAETATVAVSRLDDFGRAIATRCRWAIDTNDGDPDDAWPTADRIAVALVLGNHEYLEDMGPGPGYSPQQAAFRLWSGMAQQPPDIDAWISAIRSEIRGDASKPGAPWRPGPEVSVERRPER
jgi:hypothetical protein